MPHRLPVYAHALRPAPPTYLPEPRDIFFNPLSKAVHNVLQRLFIFVLGTELAVCLYGRALVPSSRSLPSRAFFGKAATMVLATIGAAAGILCGLTVLLRCVRPTSTAFPFGRPLTRRRCCREPSICGRLQGRLFLLGHLCARDDGASKGLRLRERGRGG